MHAPEKSRQTRSLTRFKPCLTNHPRMMLNKHGLETVDTGWLQWQKQRIDSRKWCASKLKPKKYGDRVSLAGDAENPLQTSVQVEASELFTSILQNLELKKQVG
jgi:hypothetical protein